MSDLVDQTQLPTCAIVVNSFQDPTLATCRFTYYCAACATGWIVEPDGNIHPPRAARIIRFDATGYPQTTVWFAGFQVTEGTFPPESDPWSIPADVGAYGTWPPPSGSQPTKLQFDFPPGKRFLYKLAVSWSGGSCWSDPRIYNDGSE